jgi:hypothetical protein
MILSAFGTPTLRAGVVNAGTVKCEAGHSHAQPYRKLSAQPKVLSTTTKPTATARNNKPPTLTLRVQYKGAGPTHVFAIQLKDTILSIKQQLEKIDGVPTTAQRIVFGGKDVLNAATVEDMNLHRVPKSFVLKVWPAKGKP